jgi:hypothetical protein
VIGPKTEELLARAREPMGPRIELDFGIEGVRWPRCSSG